MKSRPIVCALIVAAAASSLAACGSSTTTSSGPVPSPKATSPTASATSTSSVSAVAVSSVPLAADTCPTVVTKGQALAPVVALGRPTRATLCFEADAAGSPRILTPAAVGAGLRATLKSRYRPELCATDEARATLVLGYADGRQTQLLVDGACPAVLEPDATSPNGHRSFYIPPKYAGPFDPYN